MLAERLQIGRDGRQVAELPDLLERADGEPVAGERQAHRAREAAEADVQTVPVGPDDHQLVRLVSRD